MNRSLFLRWALVNTVFMLSLVAGAVGYDGPLHMAGKASAAAVLLVYVAASAYAGTLAWYDERRSYKASQRIELAITACPMIAMLGTVAGFVIAFGGGLDDLQQRVLGASSGLIATFVGIACALVLMLQEHMLDA